MKRARRRVRERRAGEPAAASRIRTCTCSKPRSRAAKCASESSTCGNRSPTRSPNSRWRSFIDAHNGALHEFFDADWNPAPGIEGRIVEPGHQFEWAWLLLRWAGGKHRDAPARPRSSSSTSARRTACATASRINSLLDDFSPHDAERAAVAADRAAQGRGAGGAPHGRGAVLRDGRGRGGRRCCAISRRRIPGLWYDRIDAHGQYRRRARAGQQLLSPGRRRSRSSARSRACLCRFARNCVTPHVLTLAAHCPRSCDARQ